MNEQELMDIESAYGSETCSNPDYPLKRDTFTIEEPRKQTRCQLIKCKIREYMVLEAVLLIQLLILVSILIICTRNNSLNQDTQKQISSIKTELNALRKLIGEDFVKEEIKKVDENETKKTEEVQVKPVVQKVPSKSIINSTTKKTPPPTIIPTVPTNSTPKGSLPKRKPMVPVKRFNAANYFAGATIDKSISSSSNLSPFFGFDQSNLVLVDRSEPPSNKAWCTSEKNPVLTVDLAKYINPTAVSYQHSNWSGTIPDYAPKEYSVVACLDNNCINRKPLFSNCLYNQHGAQEQICNKISKDSIGSPVAKLQFRFDKNHGNTERTCVSLVRVYSDTVVAPKQEIRRLEDITTCMNLNHHYHHNPMIYKFFSVKNCDILYSKGCCQECPECCEECKITDAIPGITITLLVAMAYGIIFIILGVCKYYSDQHSLA